MKVQFSFPTTNAAAKLLNLCILSGTALAIVLFSSSSAAQDAPSENTGAGSTVPQEQSQGDARQWWDSDAQAERSESDSGPANSQPSLSDVPIIGGVGGEQGQEENAVDESAADDTVEPPEAPVANEGPDLPAPPEAGLEEDESGGGEADGDRAEDSLPMYRVVLRMDQRTHSSLANDGFAKSKVPDQQVGRVFSIRLISPNALVGRTIDYPAALSVEDGVLTVNVSDEMMHQLEFQSLEFHTSSFEFDSILLEAEPGALQRSLELDDAGGDDAPELFVQVSSERGIMARVRNRNSLDVSTTLGEVDIPLNEILALNFDIDGKGTLLVVLKDGSRLTGRTTLRELDIVTRRGLHTVSIEDVVGFTHEDGARFEVIVQDTTAFYRLLPPGQDVVNNPR